MATIRSAYTMCLRVLLVFRCVAPTLSLLLFYAAVFATLRRRHSDQVRRITRNPDNRFHCHASMQMNLLPRGHRSNATARAQKTITVALSQDRQHSDPSSSQSQHHEHPGYQSSQPFHSILLDLQSNNHVQYYRQGSVQCPCFDYKQTLTPSARLLAIDPVAALHIADDALLRLESPKALLRHQSLLRGRYTRERQSQSLHMR